MEKLILAVVTVLLAVVVIRLAWVMLLCPRQGQPGWEKIAAFRYAHRGLHSIEEKRPENSLSAFQAAVEHDYGAELDVHLMADGNLAVVHDSDLARVCGRSAVIEKLTAAELKDYPLLNGEGECVPLLEDVLALFEGRTPLIVELKVEHNAAALTKAVMERLEDWDGTYCIESFHPGALLQLKKRWPEVIRGQLSQNFMRRGEGMLSWPVRAVLTLLLTTSLTRPDFIAYNHKDRDCASLQQMRRLYGVHEVGWTIRDQRIMEALEREGVTPIFEGFEPGPRP